MKKFFLIILLVSTLQSLNAYRCANGVEFSNTIAENGTSCYNAVKSCQDHGGPDITDHEWRKCATIPAVKRAYKRNE